jgi:Ni/Co efflux regulator RcnB
MRKFIIAGLMATSLLPAAAQAQRFDRGERAELRGDRRDIREERRDLNHYRQASRDWGRNDWRGYRDGNRDLYRGGSWRSDNRYQSFRPGVRIGIGFYQQRYQINDYGRYRLPRPAYNQRWVRHYNDVLLVDVRSGYVVDVIRNFYW